MKLSRLSVLLGSVVMQSSADNCTASDFPVDIKGVQCWGLGSKPASNEDECMQQCCGDSACEVWQWCPPSANGCSPAASCWTGKADRCTNQDNWVSRSRVAPPLPPTPVPTPSVLPQNGLARLPPMGWRSWNLYGGNVKQQLIEGIMDGMVSKKRTVDGEPTSLCDLGYCDVGLDDNWQDCNSGTGGNHYHDSDGNPIVNFDRFPDMKAMTDHAHELGLTAGWYGNNCICSDHSSGDRKFYEGDLAAYRQFGFDGYKLDGCGSQTDMQLWYEVIQADGGDPVMIENCHWGSKKPYEPTETWCPWNFYRTSGDVRANYGSVVGNLKSVEKFSSRNLSYPGCWAYPDMLEVGVHGGLNAAETRTHFGAWAIVSSPLTLSHDVNDDSIMDDIWPIIANKEVIGVSQTYAGFSGGPFQSSASTVVLDGVNYALMERGMTEAERLATGPTVAASFQYLYKPLEYDGSRAAVLLMNSDGGAQDLTLNFADVPGLAGPCHVRDIWEHKDLGTADASMTFTVGSHDAAFLVLSDCKQAALVV